jgi:hypothetical protein
MSDQNIYSGPPNWCKNAVANKQGWVNPITGEILIQLGGNFLTRPEYLAFLSNLPTPPDGFGYIYYTDKNGQNQLLYSTVNNITTYPLAKVA